MPSLSRQRRLRRGVTLIEMLVVISIMLLLVAVAVPAIRPLMEDRKVRDGASQVQAYINLARIRAMESGRPCGVLIERDPSPDFSEAGVVFYQVEVPPEFTGDFADATVQVSDVTYTDPPTNSTYYFNHPGFTVLKLRIRPRDFDSCSNASGLQFGGIRYGDRVRLNKTGPWFSIIEDPQTPGQDFPNSNGFVDFNVSGLDGDNDGWVDANGQRYLTLIMEQCLSPLANYSPAWNKDIVSNFTWTTPPVPFEIRRQPVQTSMAPLRLQKEIAIDLSASGTDQAVFTSGASPVVLLFSGTGQLERLYNENSESYVTEPVYLLVGRRDRINPMARPEDKLQNWEDLSNRWLAINSKTGAITMAQPYADPAHVDSTTQITRPLDLSESRRAARQFQLNVGGP